MDIKAIEQSYRRYARIYDLCFGAVFQPGRRAIVDRMECAPGERILEGGVGTGLSPPQARKRRGGIESLLEARNNKPFSTRAAVAAIARGGFRHRRGETP